MKGEERLRRALMEHCCPGDFGLEDIGCCDGKANKNCEECWEKAKEKEYED